MSSRVLRFSRLVLCLVFCLCLALLAFPSYSLAQIGNASLGGTVSDQSGGVVADAELTLVNTAKGIEAKSTSNERGEYTFRNLTPGNYDLRISKAGFEQHVQK